MDFLHSGWLEFSDSDLFLHEGAAAVVPFETLTAKKKKVLIMFASGHLLSCFPSPDFRMTKKGRIVFVFLHTLLLDNSSNLCDRSVMNMFFKCLNVKGCSRKTELLLFPKLPKKCNQEPPLTDVNSKVSHS